MGLRHRLMLLYTLAAAVPALIGATLVMFYLSRQLRDTMKQFQQQTQASLQDYRHWIEGSTQTLLTETFTTVREQINRDLSLQQSQLARQQSQLIGKALGTLGQRTASSTESLQAGIARTLLQTLDTTAEGIARSQSQALRQLETSAADTSRDAIRQQIEQTNLNLTVNLSRQVNAAIQSALTQLTLIAQQPALQRADLQESEWILRALQDREPSYRLLCLRNATNEKLLTISDFPAPEERLKPVTNQLWQEMTHRGEPVVGEVVMVDTGDGPEPVVPVLVPVRERGVELRGAVGALVAMDNLNALIRTFRIGQHGYAMLCTADGLILAHPDARRIGQQETQFAPLITDAGSMNPRLQEINGWLVALAPIPSLNACLIAVQPTDEAFRLATALQSHFLQARQQQQQALDNTILRIRQQASRQVSQQMVQHHRQLQQAIQRAEQQTRQEATRMLDAQQKAAQRGMDQMLTRSLLQSQHHLQQELSQLAHLSDLSRQFTALTATLQNQLKDQMINASLVGLMCMLLFMLWGSLYLYRTINMPLRALVEATQTIAGGDLSRRVQLPTRNAPELQELADSFNQMVDALVKAEAQLVQTSKLASLGTLASGVAHELNQPLAIIRGVAQQTIQMLSRLQSLSPSGGEGTGEGTWIRQLLDDMRIIERQTQRMSQIILHLRTFARKPRVDREPVNLNTVAENALILLREQLHQRGIELVEEYESSLPPVLGEPNSLEQVVINLLTNARDALEGQPDGRVVIRTRRVQESGREWVELCVQDNGPGVPPDLRMQIFDPFFTTKEPGKGTGLGLSISLEIAQKHGGTLLLGDSPAGACFILRLPAAAQQQHAA